MSILKSRREFAAELAKTDDERDRGHIEWKMSWTDGKECLHCHEGFGIDDRAWIWMCTDDRIFAHQACLIDWLPRVLVDAEQIVRKSSDKSRNQKFNLKRIFGILDAVEASE